MELNGWRCTSSKHSTMAALPSAKILERTYIDSSGHSLQVLLLTAANEADFHEATYCLRCQGYDMGEQSSVTLPSTKQSAYELVATQHSSSIRLLYWRPSRPSYAGKLGVYQWRRILLAQAALEGNQDQSLYVRFVAPADNDTRQLMLNTAGLWTPALQALSKKRVE
jgi:hypothetical protein